MDKNDKLKLTICLIVKSNVFKVGYLKLSEVLKSAKPPLRNITQEEEETFKELKQDENIVILKADKGNSTVVMNAQEYDDKINCLLSDSSVYIKLSKKSNSISIKTYGTFLKWKKLVKPNIIFYIVLKM